MSDSTACPISVPERTPDLSLAVGVVGVNLRYLMTGDPREIQALTLTPASSPTGRK